MKKKLAKILRVFFRCKLLKAIHFGIYQKIMKPLNLFKGLTCKVKHNDFLLELNIDDWIQHNIYFLGEYSASELKLLDKFLQQGAVFIDVGANIGLFTLHASRLVGNTGRVISFEPFSTNFTSLTNHIRINELVNVRAEKLALGSKNDFVNLYYNPDEQNLGMVSTHQTEHCIIEQTNIVSLDTYIKDNPVSRIDLIKIDVEGHEYEALIGMQNMLIKHRPTIIIEILEDNESLAAKNGNSKKINSYLEDLGYNKYFIGNHGDISKKETHPKRKNYLFTTN